MTDRIRFLLTCLTGGVLLTAGDYFILRWVAAREMKFLVLGFILWTLTAIPGAYSYLYGKALIASLIIHLLNLAAVGVMASMMLGQTLTVREYIGVGLAVAALVVLET